LNPTRFIAAIVVRPTPISGASALALKSFTRPFRLLVEL